MKVLSNAILLCIHTAAVLVFCATFPQTISLGSKPGPHDVGVKRVEVVDHSRQDPFAPTPQPRALMIQIWYPIISAKGLTAAPYFPANASRWIEKTYSLPNGAIDHVVTGTYLGGKIIHPLVSTSKCLPVIVCSPGSGSAAAFYTIFNRDLASEGYVVIGIDHTYDSTPVEFPDGHLVAGILTDANNTVAAEVRGQDALFVASQVTLENLSRWLPSHSGHSKSKRPTSVKLGILQLDNSPYAGGASLDGPFYGPVLTAGFRGPWWYMASNRSNNLPGLAKEWPLIRGWKEAVQVAGSRHDDYWDIPLLIQQLPGRLYMPSFLSRGVVAC